MSALRRASGRGRSIDATVQSYAGVRGCQPLRTVPVLIAGKILQAAALAYLGVSYVLTLPETPRGRDLAIAAGVFVVGWFLVRGGKGGG